MAFDWTKPIPITTVPDDNYPRPKLNADGQWVISASAVNTEPNKIMLYDPLTLIVTPVTPYTVSMDYYNQVKEHEKTLAQIQMEKDLQQKGFVDTTDPNEINSIADVFRAGSDDFGLFKSTGNFFGDVLPKLFTGKFKEAGESWWKHSDINWMVDKVIATGELIKNSMIDPVTAEIDKIEQGLDTREGVLDNLTNTGVKWLMNSLINLGETMDYVTGANFVKGFAQGLGDGGLDQAWDNVKAGNGDPYGTGRKQFDWNLTPTGNGFLDGTANILLEVISDPTNWISFGAPAIMKAVGKDSISEVILKSADDVGMVITREQSDKLAKAALRTYIYKDDSLVNAVRTIKIHDVLAAPVTPEVSVKFFDAITNNVALIKEAKTLSVLKSVRGVSDAVQSAAMKAVGYSSAVGLGFHGVKMLYAGTKYGINGIATGVQLGREGLSYAVAKMNNIFNTTGVDKMTIKNMTETLSKVENKLKTVKDLVGLADEYPAEVIRRAAKSFQEDKYAQMQRMINKNQSSTDVLRELNKWASEEGFDSINEMIAELSKRADIVPEHMVNLAQELQNEINRVTREAIVDVIKEIDNNIDPRKFFKETYINNDLLRELQKAFGVLLTIKEVTDSISPALLKRVQDVMEGAYKTNHIIHALNVYNKMNTNNIFNEFTEFFDYKVRTMTVKSVQEHYDELIAGITDPKLLRKAKKWAEQAARDDLRAAEASQFLDTGMTLVKAEHLHRILDMVPEFFGDDKIGATHVRLLRETLMLWEDNYDDITVEMMHNANILWSELSIKVRTMAGLYKKVDVGAAAKEIVAQQRAFTTLHKQLKAIMNNMLSASPAFTSIRTITADMVSKAVRDIPEALSKALRKNGYDAHELSELILNLTDTNLKDIVDEAVTADALTAFYDLIDTLDDIEKVPYFVQQLNFNHFAERWEQGFNIELGNEIISNLDELLARLGDVDDIKIDVQLMRDQLQDIVDYAYQSIETRVKTTTELVSTKLYKVKLSHIQSVIQLLTTEGVEETFEEIRRNFGVGNFLDALVDTNKPNFVTQAVSNLQSLSKSIYVSRRLLNRIHKSKLFDTKWKDGLYDTLAGMIRDHKTAIPNEHSFAAELLSRAKKFIDNKDNKHPLRLTDLSDTRDVLEEAENLYLYAFGELDEAAKYDQVIQHSGVSYDMELREYVKLKAEDIKARRNTVDVVESKAYSKSKYFAPIRNAFREDGDDILNIVYSAAQSSKNGGQIYEFSFVLPDGKSYLFLNEPVYYGMMQNMDDTIAQELFGTTAVKAREMMLNNLKRYREAPNVQWFGKTEEFAQAIYDMFSNVKQIAKDSELVPRLIGYNNALDALGTDKALSDFTYKNMLNTRIIFDGSLYKGPLAIETVDASQYIRAAYDGAAVITDDMHNEMVDIIRDVKKYLDEANTGEPFAPAFLMPDFTRDTTASIRELIAAIDNALHLNGMREAGERLGDNDYVNLTKAQYDILSFSFSDGQLEAIKQSLSSLVHNLGDELLAIKQSNQIMGQTLLIQDALTKYLHEPNIMQILNKYLVDGNGVPPLSFKLFNDPKVFNTWFVKVPEDMTTLGRMYEVAERMQSNLDRIKHPALIMDIPASEVKDVLERLKEIYLSMPKRKYSVWNEATLRLKPPGTNQLHNYLVAKQYWDSIMKISKPADVKDMMIALREQFNYSPILEYIWAAQHTVMSNDPLYVPHIKVLQSTLIDESNEILQKIKEIETITHSAAQMETLNDALLLDQYLREAHGYSLPSVHSKERLTRSYGDFINQIKAELNEALDVFVNNTDLMDTAEARFYARKAYSDKVKGVLSTLEEIKKVHATNRAQTVLNLNAEDYVKYLYKYAQGVQIIDLGAKIFVDGSPAIQKSLRNFMDTLRVAKQYGLNVKMDDTRQYLYVYLDRDMVNFKQLEEMAKTFSIKSTTPPAPTNNAIGRYYNKLVSLLDEHTDGVYGISMHRTMNSDRYDELIDFLPDDISENLITKDYLDNKDLLDTYSQTILGDYQSGVGTVFSMYSSSLVTNVAAGFNSVYNHLRGQDMYKSLLFNHEYKLKTWVDQVSRFGKVPHKDVVEAINNRSMVVCTWVEGEGVVKVPINTVWQYTKALNEGAVLLDYHSYTRAVEVLNDNRIHSKLLNSINKNFLIPLKIGQLLSVGWMLRNIPDSTIKGWVQAGFDPMYMTSMLTRTKQIIADYWYTYRQVFHYTKATLTPQKVAEFFAITEPDDRLLDEVLFKRLLTFYNHASSTATPAQLNLYNNTAKKLFLKVEGFPGITEKVVEDAIKIFADNPNFADAKRVLFDTYTEDVAKELLLLKKFVPKEKIADPWVEKIVNGFYPAKKLMEVNNSFEELIRTHTFLYHSTYTNGTVSQAIDMVTKSQFNRSLDTKAVKILEMLMPFSSFQMDNFFFWTEQATKGKNNVIALVDDVIQGAYNEEELDTEELSRNMSLQYLFLSGNLVLNPENGLTLKMNDSVHSVFQMLTNPIGSFAEMFSVPIDVAVETLKAINANEGFEEYIKYAEEHGGKEPYGETKPMRAYSAKDKWDLYSQLIPLVGVVYQRYHNAATKGRLEFSDMVLPLVMPSVFGVAKLDSAGTTYESRPIGYDWYNQSEEYKKTHRYVFGVSYVPSWMSKDPLTYANTFQRLQDMGFSAELASWMMQNGWYMKAPDYVLKHYTPYTKGVGGGKYRKRMKMFYAKRYFPRKIYAKRPRISRSYPKYSVLPKKQKKFMRKSNRVEHFGVDRSRVTRGYRVRRIYRPQLYSNRYTRTGVNREVMLNWRGANRSSRQLLRDRSKSSRLRTQRIMRQIKPS